MKIKEKIGLIGVGNMGTAILEGLLRKKLVTAGQVLVYDKITEKAAAFAKQWKAVRASSNEDLVKKSGIVILAVKPQDLNEAVGEFRSSLSLRGSGKILISILAGMTISKIRQAAGGGPQIVRAMPNLGAKVGESVTAITGENPSALKAAEAIFSGCWKVLRMEEKHFDLVTALSGSGPAYFFLLMEMLAEEGAKRGLSREESNLLAIQTGVGAGRLAQSSSVSPAELRVMVTSKGGTTEAALKILEEGNIRKIFSDAIAAAIERGRFLRG